MTEKYCKCGHNKNIHKKKPESSLSSANWCRKCPCTEYMNRELPNLISKICFILGIITLGTFSVLTITILLFVYLASFTIEWNEQIQNVTTGEYLVILSMLLILCNILFFYLAGGLFEYLKERKRSNYSISGDTS